MELNEKQNKLMSDFAAKHANHSTTGHLHPSTHITDVRKLVEDCIKAHNWNNKK